MSAQWILVTAVISCLCSFTPVLAASGVFVNKVELSPQEVALLRIPPGHYWYDARAGLWGCIGGPTMGIVAAGGKAAPLPADASNGNTGVFVNGRQLPTQDVTVLMMIVGGPIPPGRYWLNADGTYGIDGNPMPLGRLQAPSGGGSSSGCFWSDLAGGGGCVGEGVSFRNSDGSTIGFTPGVGSTGSSGRRLMQAAGGAGQVICPAPAG